MNWHERGPSAAIEGPDTTAGGHQGSDFMVTQRREIVTHDPGTFGLAISIAALPTAELREMVRLLTVFGPAFGFHGLRRRELAMRELRRRMVVR